MRHQYLMIDSRGNPVAHGTSDDGLEKSVWEIQVDSGDIKRVLGLWLEYLIKLMKT